MGFFCCYKITLISSFEVSHSISKVFVKLGNDNNGAEINFAFNKLKACTCSLPHLKSIDFLTILVKGATRVLKSLTNLL
jgi:hypothetical protein